jgi:hypothetical protein
MAQCHASLSHFPARVPVPGGMQHVGATSAIAGKCTIIWDQHIELIRSLIGSTFCRKYVGKGCLFAFRSLLTFLSLVACCSRACTIVPSLVPRAPASHPCRCLGVILTYHSLLYYCLIHIYSISDLLVEHLSHLQPLRLDVRVPVHKYLGCDSNHRECFYSVLESY